MIRADAPARPSSAGRRRGRGDRWPGSCRRFPPWPGARPRAPGTGCLDLLTGWSFDLSVWLPVLLAGGVYLLAVRHVNLAHPDSPVPRRRAAYWLAGLVVLILALQSPIERYDTTLFSVHMVQHLLITMVAAQLLVLAAPITLLLRAASPQVRKRAVLPVLHSRVVRVLAFPVVSWVVFTGFMFSAHFSPLFDASLEDPAIHQLEHAGFLLTAMLFWWPADRGRPERRGACRTPRRLLYLALGMPFSSFLGLAIVSATGVLYPHYAIAGPDMGHVSARGPELGRRDHVGGGDRLLPDRAGGRGRRLAARGGGGGAP